jgi:hypothetical protein
MSNRNCTNSRGELLKDNQISSSMTINTPAISSVPVAHSLPEFTPAINAVPFARTLPEFTPAINAVPVANSLPKFIPAISSAPVAHSLPEVNQTPERELATGTELIAGLTSGRE